MRSKNFHEGIALYPNREKVKNIKIVLRKQFKDNLNITSYELIAKINPIIKG